jgi:hypothetical protein
VREPMSPSHSVIANSQRIREFLRASARTENTLPHFFPS